MVSELNKDCLNLCASSPVIVGVFSIGRAIQNITLKNYPRYPKYTFPLRFRPKNRQQFGVAKLVFFDKKKKYGHYVL